MAQANAAQMTRPAVQNMAWMPRYGPRYLLRTNSDVYGTITGREPATLERKKKEKKRMTLLWLLLLLPGLMFWVTTT